MLARDTRSNSGGAVARLTEALGIGGLHLPSMKDIRGMLSSSHPSESTSPTATSEHAGSEEGPKAETKKSSHTPHESHHAEVDSEHATFEDMHSHADVHQRASELVGLKTLNVDERDEAVELLARVSDPGLALKLESKVEDTLQKINYQQQHKEEDQLMAREGREEVTVLQQFRQRFMQALGKLINKVQPTPAETTGTDVA